MGPARTYVHPPLLLHRGQGAAGRQRVGSGRTVPRAQAISDESHGRGQLLDELAPVACADAAASADFADGSSFKR